VLGDEVAFAGVVGQGELVRRREVSARELVELAFSRIDRLDPELNAFAAVYREHALREAAEADARVAAGESAPLLGVPVAVKDEIDIGGEITSYGTGAMVTRAPTDAEVVRRLRAAGAIVVGKTTMPELGLWPFTESVTWGVTRNPWDLERTPGGSSGGEAAAIAAGMSAGGVGSDGGGSIRVPAHFSGICGLKPTPGRIPATGHFPASGGPFALIGVVGPMARTVADVKVMFEVMQGPDDGDTCAAPVRLRWPSDDQVRKLRIGYFEDDGRTPVSPEIRAAVRTAAEALRGAGFQVEPFRPDGLEETRVLWKKFFVAAGGMLIRPMFHGREHDLSPMLKEFLEWSRAEPPLTGESLLEAWIGRDTLRVNFLAQTQRYPILLCPAAAIPAFRHGERSWTVEGKTVNYLDAWSYTEWFNLLGNPTVVVPVSHSTEGLPIGVQIVGRPWEEEQVLAVAEVMEKQCGAWKIPAIR